MLKVRPDFFLPLIVKFKTEEINEPIENQVLIIWEIISLSRLQKMPKLGDSLSGSVLWTESQGCGPPFASALEGSKGQSVPSHRGSLKRLWLMDALNHLSRNPK